MGVCLACFKLAPEGTYSLRELVGSDRCRAPTHGRASP